MIRPQWLGYSSFFVTRIHLDIVSVEKHVKYVKSMFGKLENEI